MTPRPGLPGRPVLSQRRRSMFVPFFLVGLTKVDNNDAGAAWSTSGRSAARSGWRSSAPWAGARWPATCAPRPPRLPERACTRPAPGRATLQAQIYHHALAAGFFRGYLVSAGVLALIPIIALFMMRVSRADLSGADPRRPVTPAHRTWREVQETPLARPACPGHQPGRVALPRSGEGASRPRARARATASARVCVPSLAYRWVMWVLTVLCETYSSPAISGPDRLVGR